MRTPVQLRRRPGRLWPALSALTLLTYNTWVLWQPMNGNARIFDGYLSELSASDQPNNLFFRGGDMITALIVLALGVRALLIWRHHSPHRQRWWVVAGLALVLFGVSTFIDSFFAMDCSPVLSETCRVAEESGQLSTIHYAHTYTSVGAQAGIVASMIATYVALRRGQLGIGRRQGGLLALCAVEVLALTVMMIMLAAGLPGLGYPQVVMVAAASVWFAAVGFGVVVETSTSSVEAAPAKDDHYAH